MKPLILAALIATVPLSAMANGYPENEPPQKEQPAPDKPKGDKPQREKPKADRPAPERPSDTKPATRGSWCIAPTGQIARVDGANGNPPPRHTLHACGPFIHRKGGKVGEW